jgi:hypothetical protein
MSTCCTEILSGLPAIAFVTLAHEYGAAFADSSL